MYVGYVGCAGLRGHVRHRQTKKKKEKNSVTTGGVGGAGGGGMHGPGGRGPTVSAEKGKAPKEKWMVTAYRITGVSKVVAVRWHGTRSRIHRNTHPDLSDS